MERKLPILASDAPARRRSSNYPEPFYTRMLGRTKQPLGDLFGLQKFGVNLTRLRPHGESALLHRHSKQDEFVYVVCGRPTLCTEDGRYEMKPGMCIGFRAGEFAHQIVNDTDEDAVLIEIGDREVGDTVDYPADDLSAKLGPDGNWVFTTKDGSLYPSASNG